MRRAIIIVGALLSLLAAAIRVDEKPLYATLAAYESLPKQEPHLLFIAGVGLLLVFLWSAAQLYHKRGLPIDGLVLLSLSPAVIMAITVPDPSALALGAFVAIAAVHWEKRHILMMIGSLASLTVPAGSLLSAAVAAGGAARKDWVQAGLGIAVTLLGAVLHPVQLNMQPFVELSGPSGVSLVLLLLAITGVVVAWNSGTYPKLLMALAGAVGAIMVPALAYAGALGATALGGLAMKRLRERTWRLEAIKKATLYLVILSIAFASISAFSQTIKATPGEDILKAATILKDAPKGSVLVWPEHLAAAKWLGIPATSKGHAVLNDTYRINDAKTHLPRYVLLHEDDDANGLRFVIRNTDEFIPITTGDYSLWEVKP